jgi:hypothetical protein
VFSRGLRLNEFGHALSLSLALVDRGEKQLLRRGMKKSMAYRLARMTGLDRARSHCV